LRTRGERDKQALAAATMLSKEVCKNITTE